MQERVGVSHMSYRRTTVTRCRTTSTTVMACQFRCPTKKGANALVRGSTAPKVHPAWWYQRETKKRRRIWWPSHQVLSAWRMKVREPQALPPSEWERKNTNWPFCSLCSGSRARHITDKLLHRNLFNTRCCARVRPLIMCCCRPHLAANKDDNMWVCCCIVHMPTYTGIVTICPTKITVMSTSSRFHYLYVRFIKGSTLELVVDAVKTLHYVCHLRGPCAPSWHRTVKPAGLKWCKMYVMAIKPPPKCAASKEKKNKS